MKKSDVWPHELLHNPNPDMTIEEYWDTVDSYTFESRFEADDCRKDVDFVIPLPPLKYDGKWTKGIFYSQAVDRIVQELPQIKEIFFPIAHSMFGSYPQSEHADYYFGLYNNPKREKHFKKKHPEKKDKIILPMQRSDFMNEYAVAPTFSTPKTIDVLVVSTAYPVKHPALIASAVKMYELKYGKRLKVEYVLGSDIIKKNEDGSIDYSEERFDVKDELKKVDDILIDTKRYIDFIPYIKYKELTKHYTQAKCFVLASILEGKNRSILEAMSCNTPIIVFKDHNKFLRGNHPVFFENSGEYAPEFTPESLAETIHKVITGNKKYEPRKNVLKYFGRKNFLNTCIDMNPYYKKNLPGYKKGKIMENIWVDLAMQSNYQLSLHDFLYAKNPAIHHIRGMDDIHELVDFFYSRFGIRKK